MIKRILGVILLISVAIIFSFKIKAKTNDGKIDITILKDSVLCENYYNYIFFPYINKSCLLKSEKINKIINNQIIEQWSLEPLITIKEQLAERQLMLDRCCEYSGNCSIFDKGFEILHNDNYLLTINFLYSTFKAEDFNRTYSYNLLLGEKVTSKIFNEKKIDELIKNINKITKKELNSLKAEDEEIVKEIKENNINSEYTRSRLDHIYITSNNSKPGIVFLFNYGFFSSSLEPNMVNKLFFTFEELKPYLTKGFKKQIDIK